jgi:hypothetical protein
MNRRCDRTDERMNVSMVHSPTEIKDANGTEEKEEKSDLGLSSRKKDAVGEEEPSILNKPAISITAFNLRLLESHAGAAPSGRLPSQTSPSKRLRAPPPRSGVRSQSNRRINQTRSAKSDRTT